MPPIVEILKTLHPFQLHYPNPTVPGNNLRSFFNLFTTILASIYRIAFLNISPQLQQDHAAVVNPPIPRQTTQRAVSKANAV